jgi:hypothetical protein
LVAPVGISGIVCLRGLAALFVFKFMNIGGQYVLSVESSISEGSSYRRIVVSSQKNLMPVSL